MRIPARLSIGVKMASVSIAMLLVAMITTAFQASTMFKDESSQKEKDSNKDLADARASEISVTLEKVVEKAMFYGPLLAREGVTQSAAAAEKTTVGGGSLLRKTFAKDSDLVSFAVYSLKDGKPKLVKRLTNGEYLKGYNLDSSYLKHVAKERPFPVREVFGGELVLRNRSLPKGAPLLTVGIPVLKDDVGKVSHVAVADVRLSTIQKAFAEKGVRLVYLVDARGEVYAHPDEKLAVNEANLKSLAIVEKAIASPVNTGYLRFQKKGVPGDFIGAFSKTRFGLIVIAEASEAIILEPAARIERRVYVITAYSLFGALFVIFLLSLTITRPIDKLVQITKEIARGNFGIPVARSIATNDEVGTLAVSFDSMLAGLRERDKVKSLFSKFHGSTVAESLMSADKVERGGKRKQIVVFFSDIRGFTAISETSSPEQVVAMVNEYFNIMVRIILKHHGIVDKFIGDAIMATWGAIDSTGNDAHHAVTACLEMRKALAELNALRIGRGEAPLKIGMGLHTGEAISGQIGSDERMELTVIGDTVNMASRIEASTKAFGTDLLLSEHVVAAVKNGFIMRLAGKAKVKGKTDALSLYCVDGFIATDGTQQLVKTEYSDYEAEGADKVELAS